MKLLKQLTEIHAPSGEEFRMKEFLVKYIEKEQKKWKVQPEIFHGDAFQDCIVLCFGKPRTAIFAHMDSVGFTVRYHNQLLPIGSPDATFGTLLVGEDTLGPIECTLQFDPDNHALYSFGRQIERGTSLTYKPNFRETREYIQSPYLDNRIGIFVALSVAETLENGIVAFSAWEEHGGGAVPYLARFIHERWRVRQALVADVTWVTDGVESGKGVVISMRDRNIPRRQYINRIIDIARSRKFSFQLEVEAVGSSDGRELQLSPYPFDWCFIGPPQLKPHSPDEKVHKSDLEGTIELYRHLMNDL